MGYRYGAWKLDLGMESLEYEDAAKSHALPSPRKFKDPKRSLIKAEWQKPRIGLAFLPSSNSSTRTRIPPRFLSRCPHGSLVICIHKSGSAFGKRLHSHLCFIHAAELSLVNNSKLHRRLGWLIRSSADGSGLGPSLTNNTSRVTRLVRAVQAILIGLTARIKKIRRNFPVKLLFFLVGFYCATALTTVIGQTGDWDILSAALAVAIVEGIGALMYRGHSLPLVNRVRSLVAVFNYWKAGLSLGFFLDSFKYEVENIVNVGFNSPFDFKIDICPKFF
ncbi:uncharacterized protein LOC127802109 [Diospyros lotus]|uniref:uncharacterized protein LOC127802109 n=1 Tax=Diospyros lotus TaxID=55363 RepID=UPI002259E465|nr:uncharacterized protein LOC127802109 [Diospyros lotus]